MVTRLFTILLLAALPIFGCQPSAQPTAEAAITPVTLTTQQAPAQKPKHPYYSRTDITKVRLSNAEWKKILPPDLYHIAREKGTERAFTGKLWNFTGVGTYYCAACGNALFKSDAKFASDCGWPSFFEPIRKKSVLYKDDYSLNMERIEVLCGRCDAHLGHIFDDGPEPTGKRFCMNSISLDFEPGSALQVN